MNEKSGFALVRKPSSAVEKAAPGLKHILSGMVSDTLVVADAQAESWYQKGQACYHGKGVRKNYSKAVKWFRLAAERGHVKAQCNLANCYTNGEGVSQDYTEAEKWYLKAAKQGNAEAQNSLGDWWAYGDPQNQDAMDADMAEFLFCKAAKWYHKAAEQGNADAQNNLGYCYAEGFGVPQDYTQAVAWYRKAAEQGDPMGQNMLGHYYMEGTGVSKDLIEAYKWFRLAAEQIPKFTALKAVSDLLSPEQFQEGERRYREFRLRKKSSK